MLRRCPATAPPRTDNHEQSGAKEVGSGGKQSYQAAVHKFNSSTVSNSIFYTNLVDFLLAPDLLYLHQYYFSWVSKLLIQI